LDLNPEKKLAGVLAPVFALRGNNDLGVGDTAAVRELITWSARQGLRVVQVLPINETGSDCSPYNLLSAMALEPSTIATHPDDLPDLAPEDFAAITGRHDVAALRAGPVRYGPVKALKRELLYAAFKRFRSRAGDRGRLAAFAAFEKTHAGWLADYAVFRALVSWNGESEVSTAWPEAQRSPATAAVWIAALPAGEKRKFRDLVRFHAYVQWIAWEQWRAVRRHAEGLGVALIGDVPVGVSIYSADVWQQPEIFDLARSSGAPPEKVFKADPFTEKWGQNWGFPLYHWDVMARDNYAWWRRRLRLLMSVFDLLRVDHALGFFRIYSFPWRPEDNARFTDLTPEEAAALTGGELPHFVERDDTTEENREINRRHGERLFQMLLEEIGRHRLIAEDLGEVAPYVRPTLEALEIPGFKIPQWERIWDRLIPGSDYQRLSLATYATHDHPPVRTFWNGLDAAARDPDATVRDAAIHSMWELVNFCGRPDYKLPQPYNPELHELLVHTLLASNSWLVVSMLPDLFGTEERFNVPGSAGDTNWTERLGPISGWEAAQAAPLAVLRRAIALTGRV
jgi:4-alpha-glucanotransferase